MGNLDEEHALDALRRRAAKGDASAAHAIERHSRLRDSHRDASLLGLALTTSEEGARLHMVAGTMAQAWSTASRGLLPLADALECARNAVAATQAEVGICHAVYDAVSYRRAMPDLYPAWSSISHCTAMRFGVIAVQVWAAKGWRR